MLPSRGLRPAQLVSLASRQSAALRSLQSRQYSSLHRTAALSTSSCPRSTHQSAHWRSRCTSSPSHSALPSVASVRYGSWYAPWSWGRSNPAAGDAAATSPPELVHVAEFSNRPVSEMAAQHASQDGALAADSAAATTATATSTTEAATAAAEGTSTTASETTAASDLIDSKTLEDLLNLDPSTIASAKPPLDPTTLIDHAGQLKELGLDYGWGMTTLIEKSMEQIYLASGWGWAGSIIATCAGVRVMMFFLQALNSDNMAVMASLKPVTKPIQDKLDAAIASGDQKEANLLRLKQQEIMKPYMGGIISMGGFMIAQGWIGFSAFRLLRALGELPVPGMAYDGYLWFTDLTVSDPYYVLPMATTAIMYTVFKFGGESGIQQDAASQKYVMYGMSGVIGAITAFQPAGVQLYFLASGIFGGITGWLLRRNWFRRLIRIRPIPTAESNELFSKVARGELTLGQITGPDGKITYQAPKATRTKMRATASKSSTSIPISRSSSFSSSSSSAIPGLRIKAGTTIPAHLRPASAQPQLVDPDEPPTHDPDFEEGVAGKPLREKLDYYRRNYRVSYVTRRMAAGFERTMRKMGYGGKKVNVAEEKRRRKAEEWEIERRRRFENRR